VWGETGNERAGTGADVEAEPSGDLGEVSHQTTLPETINPEAQHTVEFVIGGSDLIEHVSHIAHRNRARKA
jgi:hypothetical protein